MKAIPDSIDVINIQIKDLRKEYGKYFGGFMGMKLKTIMSRVADDKSGRYLPAKLIGAIMSKRDAKPSNNLFWSDK